MNVVRMDTSARTHTLLVNLHLVCPCQSDLLRRLKKTRKLMTVCEEWLRLMDKQ